MIARNDDPPDVPRVVPASAPILNGLQMSPFEVRRKIEEATKRLELMHFKHESMRRLAWHLLRKAGPTALPEAELVGPCGEIDVTRDAENVPVFTAGEPAA